MLTGLLIVFWVMQWHAVGIMSDFDDTDLLYRGPGGEQRRLIDQARRLYDRLNDTASLCSKPCTRYYRLRSLRDMAAWRYRRRYDKYYHTQQEDQPINQS